MEKIELAPGIVSYKNVLDQSDLNTLTDDIEESLKALNIDWQLSEVQGSQYVEVDTNSRDTHIIGVPYYDKIVEEFHSPSDAFFISLSNLFFSAFNPREIDYKNMYQFATDWHDQYGLLKYGVGQKFTNHIDDHINHHRRMSTTFYLNDNYEGGEILFPRFGIDHKPEKNELLVFPSTYVYNHSVLPVKSGTRYAVVSWLK